MRFVTRLLVAAPLALALSLALWAAPGALLAQPPCCVMPENGNGTADHPPSCAVGYAGHTQMVNGLPPGTTVQIPSFLGIPGGFAGLVQVPGGALGGMSESWTSAMVMQLNGTGSLSTYNRVINMPILAGTTHSAPRTAFAPVQSFNTDLFMMQGQLPPGDPDFDLLRITAGTGFGLPSPGHTIFSNVGYGWSVDSYFDITYRIDFVGSPTGPFAGMSGSTTGVYRFVMCHEEPTGARPATWGALKVLYR